MSEPAGHVAVLRIILASLILVAWPVLSSHALLAHWGLIHAQSDSHHHSHDSQTHPHHHAQGSHSQDHANGSTHDLADGACLRAPSAFEKRISDGVAFGIAPIPSEFYALVAELISRLPCSWLPPPGITPPHLESSWQFQLRTALPARAPSQFS